MPKITKGGVSDVQVDPDYIAPPGVPPAYALEIGLPDAGKPEREESSPGKTSSPESEKQSPPTKKPNEDGASPSTAPSTAGRSTAPKKASSTASSAGTS